jgi:hypothetical protein
MQRGEKHRQQAGSKQAGRFISAEMHETNAKTIVVLEMTESI